MTAVFRWSMASVGCALPVVLYALGALPLVTQAGDVVTQIRGGAQVIHLASTDGFDAGVYVGASTLLTAVCNLIALAHRPARAAPSLVDRLWPAGLPYLVLAILLALPPIAGVAAARHLETTVTAALEKLSLKRCPALDHRGGGRRVIHYRAWVVPASDCSGASEAGSR